MIVFHNLKYSSYKLFTNIHDKEDVHFWYLVDTDNMHMDQTF